MTGKIQKPYDQLQYKRGGRRRGGITLFPLSEEAEARRLAALNAVVAGFDRAFSRSTSAPTTSEPTAPGKQHYRPKGSRPASAAKARIASVRPRDSQGRFIRQRGGSQHA